MGWLDIASGAGAGLDKMLADRLAEEHWQRKQKEEERSNLATETYRSQTLKDAEENRRLQREQAGAAAKLVEDNRVRDDMRSTVEQLPSGTELSPIRLRQLTQAGALAPERVETIVPYGQDFTGPIQEGGPQRGESLGRLRMTAKESHDANMAAQAEERQERSITAADERARLDRAAAEARAKANRDADLGGIRTVTELNDKGEKVVRIVTGSGKVVHEAPAPLSAGMQKESVGLRQLSGLARDIEAFGNKIGWEGVGSAGYGSIAGAAKNSPLGIGSNEADVLRSLIGNVVAEVGHEKYGSALTASERAMLRSFAPTINMTPDVIQNRLRVLTYVLDARADQFERGLPQTAITPSTLDEMLTRLMGGRGGAATPASPATPGAPAPQTSPAGGADAGDYFQEPAATPTAPVAPGADTGGAPASTGYQRYLQRQGGGAPTARPTEAAPGAVPAAAIAPTEPAGSPGLPGRTSAPIGSLMPGMRSVLRPPPMEARGYTNVETSVPPTQAPMTLSAAGLERLKGTREGGFQAAPYNDSGTGLAIGYGMQRWQGQPVTPGLRITQEQADAEMQRQLQAEYLPIVNALKVPVSQEQYDALVSVAWNHPATAKALVAKLNRGEPLTEQDFQRSATIKGQPSPALRGRRGQEYAPFQQR